MKLESKEPQDPLQRVFQPVLQIFARSEGRENHAVDNWSAVIVVGPLRQGKQQLDVVVRGFQLPVLPL